MRMMLQYVQLLYGAPNTERALQEVVVGRDQIDRVSFGRGRINAAIAIFEMRRCSVVKTANYPSYPRVGAHTSSRFQ
jgi:hypothetical protein